MCGRMAVETTKNTDLGQFKTFINHAGRNTGLSNVSGHINVLVVIYR